MRIARGGPRSTRKGRPNPRRPSRLSTNERTNERTNAFAGRDRRGPAALVAVVAFGSRRLCSRGLYLGRSCKWHRSACWIDVQTNPQHLHLHTMEALVRASFAGHVAAIRDLERREDDALPRHHSAELERLRERVCVAALGVRGADEVRHRSRRHPSFLFDDIHVTSPRSPRPAGIRQGPRAEPPREDQDGHRRVRRGVGRAQRRQQAARDGTRRRGESAPRRPGRDARDGPAARATRPGGEGPARGAARARGEARARDSKRDRATRSAPRGHQPRWGCRWGDDGEVARRGGDARGGAAQTRWTQRETARMDAPGTLPTPAPTPPTRPRASPRPEPARREFPREARPGALASCAAATGLGDPWANHACV